MDSEYLSFSATNYCCMFPYCGKRYTTRFNLKRHVETVHRIQDNHKCQICLRKFSNQERLDEHRRKHRRIKHFACDECDTVFGNLSQLSKHIKTVHIDGKLSRNQFTLTNSLPNTGCQIPLLYQLQEQAQAQNIMVPIIKAENISGFEYFRTRQFFKHFS